MEINKLRKPDGLRYRVTANELPGDEFAANIQIRSDVVVESALTGERPLELSVSNALIEIATEMMEGSRAPAKCPDCGGKHSHFLSCKRFDSP
jgi:hypothetical protein